MKKILLTLSFLLSLSISHAALDSQSSMRPSVWRSSITCNTGGWGVLSTGTIHVHSVEIDSATLNNSGSSFISLFNSTAIPNSNNANNFATTGTFTSANITGQGFGDLPDNQYDAYFSSGVVVNKQGGACISIWWDFVTPIDKRPFLPWTP